MLIAPDLPLQCFPCQTSRLLRSSNLDLRCHPAAGQEDPIGPNWHKSKYSNSGRQGQGKVKARSRQGQGKVCSNMFHTVRDLQILLHYLYYLMLRKTNRKNLRHVGCAVEWQVRSEFLRSNNKSTPSTF